MEIIHIQLSNEASKVIVLEIFGKDFVTEFIDAFYYEAISLIIPANYVIRFRITHNFICFYQEWGYIRMCISSSRGLLNSNSITPQQLGLLLVDFTTTRPVAILALCSQLPTTFVILIFFCTCYLLFIALLDFISVGYLSIGSFLLTQGALAVFSELVMGPFKMLVAKTLGRGIGSICLFTTLPFWASVRWVTLHHLTLRFLGLQLAGITYVWVVYVWGYISSPISQ